MPVTANCLELLSSRTACDAQRPSSWPDNVLGCQEILPAVFQLAVGDDGTLTCTQSETARSAPTHADVMSSKAADCHGCLVCHNTKRPLWCADCVNQALREKRQFSDEAYTRCEAARGALEAALQVSAQSRDAGSEHQRRLPQCVAAQIWCAGTSQQGAHKHSQVHSRCAEADGCTAEAHGAQADDHSEAACRRAYCCSAGAPADK